MQSEANCEEIKTKCRRDRLTLENQLDMEKVRAEVEKKKFASQLEVLQKEKVSLFMLNCLSYVEAFIWLWTVLNLLLKY